MAFSKQERATLLAILEHPDAYLKGETILEKSVAVALVKKLRAMDERKRDKAKAERDAKIVKERKASPMRNSKRISG
jgi:hypothetical protein